MGIGKTNKRKGSNAERYYASQFRDLGFDKCVTSRYGSKIHDDAGIDLLNIPYNIQIKAGKQTGLNTVKTLLDMKERISKLFPLSAPEYIYPRVLIHKREGTRGVPRTDEDEIVSMTFEDFKKFINDSTRNKSKD